MSAQNIRTPLQIKVRKLRKKLRQIDNLLTIDRDLTDEELLKVARRETTRSELQSVLSSLPQEEEDSLYGDSELSTDYNTTLESSTASYHVNVANNQDVSNLSSEKHFYVQVQDNEQVLGNQKCSESLTESFNDDNMRTISWEKSDVLGEVSEIKSVMAHGHGDSVFITESTVQDNKQKKQEINVSKTSPKDIGKSNAPINMRVTKQPKTAKTKSLPAFREKCFSLISLEGHNDLITAIDSDGYFVITGSRDTTLRCWDIGTGVEKRSFGGHAGTVTSVVLLNKQESKDFIGHFKEDTDLPFDDHDSVIFSGSTDCSIKVWALESGQQIKNIYTFNPITNLGYVAEDRLLLASTVGGKVELWSPHSGQNVFSTIAHKESVNCQQIKNDYIYTGSADGEIQIHQYKDKSLKRIYSSENMKLKLTGEPVFSRSIRCLYSDGQVVYYGDDGSNVKVLYWKDGEVDKLSNHLCEFGSTNATVIFDGVVYTSGYDIDNGLGYINCRNVSTKQYMGTLCDDESGCILSLCSVRNSSGELVIITGGTHLKMWVEMNSKEKDCLVHPRYIKYYEKEAKHSDTESGTENDNSEDENESYTGITASTSAILENKTQHGNSWLSWCTVL